ncbi:unnamed protein product [marine sediment metagenome]|uniref:Uncharacterized protein n=1 Tax=marine sediment metagenome TaxID=412755 RepID=X1FIN4_9ZZZZ
MGEDKRTCVKVTAHYSDGSTEDFDIFLLTAANGLTLVGMDEGEPLYMGEKGKFGVMNLGRIAAPPDVVAAIVKSAISGLGNLFADLPPPVALQLLQMMNGIKMSTTGHSEGRIKRMNSQEN